MNEINSVSRPRPRRRLLRFGLLELLLVTGVVAAWLPTIIARQKFQNFAPKSR